jgi:hypothetical protein
MLITDKELKEYLEPGHTYCSAHPLDPGCNHYDKYRSINQKGNRLGFFNTGSYEDGILSLYGVIFDPSIDLKGSMEIIFDDYLIPSNEILSMDKVEDPRRASSLSFYKVSFKINIEDIIPSPYSTK